MDDGWKIDLGKLESLIDEETRMIILNNPNNPTSKVMDSKTLDGIVKLANKKGVTILSDEVYGAISFVETKSILDYDSECKHILTNGFSKTFTMTGWRIGYIVANKMLIDNVTKINQITINNVPVFIQEAALKGLELQKQLASKIKDKYNQRADLASSKLSAAGFKFTKPEAPFYMFPKWGVWIAKIHSKPARSALPLLRHLFWRLLRTLPFLNGQTTKLRGWIKSVRLLNEDCRNRRGENGRLVRQVFRLQRLRCSIS
jgi:aspartate/methionine/tyrosine aminotransferase